MKKKKGFTLIELIAVLVIMAIIALIVTPLVLNIIRKAKISADKRSIDAYGRSIEYAIATYLLDTGDFPTDISQLTIEYSGDEVVCETAQLNSDSSVYLTGCTVGGRSVEYTYGKDNSSLTTNQSYSIGDHISYNGVTYYVIEDSDSSKSTVKLLKENLLTRSEMESFGITGLTIQEEQGYAQVQYGSSTDYSTSTVKQIVDAWKNIAVKSGDTATARLITIDDLVNNLEYELTGGFYDITENTPSWVYSSEGEYVYWTMTVKEAPDDMYSVGNYGNIEFNPVSVYYSIRPVLEISKNADLTILNS